MLYLLLFVSVVAFMLFQEHLKNKRIRLVCEMEALYDEMTLYVVKNKIKPDSKIINWLKNHKNIIVNSELADIQILLVVILTKSNETLRRTNDYYKKYEASLPSELVILSNCFAEKMTSLINLSCWKPDFVWFLFKLALLRLCMKGKEGAYSLWKDIKHYIADPYVAVVYGQKLGIA